MMHLQAKGYQRWPGSPQQLGERYGTDSLSQPAQLTPWPWSSSLQICEAIHFDCLSHSVYGSLLWQPWKIYQSWYKVKIDVT